MSRLPRPVPMIIGLGFVADGSSTLDNTLDVTFAYCCDTPPSYINNTDQPGVPLLNELIKYHSRECFADNLC